MKLSFDEHEEYSNFKKKINAEEREREMTEEELKEWKEWAESWKDSDGLPEDEIVRD